MSYARHTLCYLNPTTIAASEHSEEQQRLFQYWLNRGYPFICSRQPQDIASGQIQLALPYFNHQQRKLRLSYQVSKSKIAQRQELPKFADVFPSVLLETPADIKVYGSYCWQYLTQESYVQANSDLDVLIVYEAQSLTDFGRLYKELSHKSKVLHIDGEIRFPLWGDCSLPELLQSSDSILFKSINNVRLLSREELYAAYPSLCF
ncbi:malonate decarboxylase holo-[acyl-carrier-protein] synthase [Legionella rowbothamii]|uniref:malonate decarboxylase holo-[acyl-carrier-protein] synthase n=1 Tax=Legionella rowbothamii TaxID=96229 RepID=UPI0010554682|nr:malonate decarboxylase holo-[acyl-carrier-protein] synthase [Legionella rowbothamii]